MRPDAPIRTSAVLHVDGRPLRLHAIRTGTVTVKRCHHRGCLPEATPYPLRFAAILADRRFGPPLPIWTFVLEHPDGPVVIDTGVTPGYHDDATWAEDPVSMRLVRSFIRIDVAEAETLPAQMREVGLDPAAVPTVVLTHQHVDHTAAVPAFTAADVVTTRAEAAAARRIGAVPFRWRPPRHRIRHVDVEGRPGPLGATLDVTADGAVQAVHTPGHTPGSVSVVIHTDDGEVWCTGDTSFTAEGMDPDRPTAGIHTDPRAVRRLQGRLADRGLLLPSHDWTIPARLHATGR